MSDTQAGKRRFLFPVLAIVVSTIVSVILLEIVLRLFHPIGYRVPPVGLPDGHIVGRFVPNQELLTGTGHNPFRVTHPGEEPVRINKYGFRGPDHAREKAEGSIRLVALGGSSTFDFHSMEQDTWPGRLGTCLERAYNRKFEIVNLALPGFDTSKSKINYLVNGRFFKPDAILVYHTWNDLKYFRLVESNPEKMLFTPVKEAMPFNRVVKNFFAHFQLARHMQAVYMRYYETQRENSALDNLTHANQSAPIAPSAYGWFEKNFRDIVAFAQSDGVLPILISQATLANPENNRPEILKHVRYDYLAMTQPLAVEAFDAATGIIEKVARETDSIYVDGHNKVPSTLEYMEDGVHLTPKGNEALANLICIDLQKSEKFAQLLAR